jgi:hypothetical protein
MGFKKAFFVLFITLFSLINHLSAASFVNTSNLSSKSANGAQPLQVQMDERGNAVAVWQEPLGDIGTSLQGAILPAGKTQWIKTNTITSPNLTIKNPQRGGAERGVSFYSLAVNAEGYAIVFFNEGKSDDTIEPSAFRSRTLAPGSTTWSAPLTLEANALGGPVDVEIDREGNAFATWLTGSGAASGAAVKAAYLPFEGTAWTNISTLAKNASGEAQIALDSANNAVVVWGTKKGLNSSTLLDGSQSWTSPVAIPGTVQSDPNENIAFFVDISPQGYAVVTFVNKQEQIQYATVQLGNSWKLGKVLSAAPAISPVVSINAFGDATITWAFGPSFRVQAVEIPFEGAPRKVATLTTNGGPRPFVAVDAVGNAILLWNEDSGSNSTIKYATRAPLGNWSAPRTIRTVPAASFNPFVSVNSLGNAVAVFSNDTNVFGATLRASSVTEPVRIRLKKNEFATQTEYYLHIKINSRAFSFPVDHYIIYENGEKIKTVSGRRGSFNLRGLPRHGEHAFLIVAVGTDGQRAAVTAFSDF